MTTRSCAVLACLVAASTALGTRPSSPPQSTIVELAAATPELSTLVTALTVGGLTDTLSGPGPFTVFAPTNEAFAQLPPLYLKLLLDPKNTKTLQNLLRYHVTKSVAPIFSQGLENGQKIGTVEGQAVAVKISRRGFSKIVMIDNATVSTADVAASNGVVHIVDTVLMPPQAPPLPNRRNVAQLAATSPTLSTLASAISAANLTHTLSGPGPFTVFAPSNEAFAKLPPLYLQLLLDPANIEALQTLLTYHVVNADVAVFSKDLTNGEKIATVEGRDVTVAALRDPLTFWKITLSIDNATVTTADVAGGNGVVHIIDTVLMPPNMPPAPSPGSPNHLYFVRVVKANPPLFAGSCGQVDAGPRVPPALFEPQNKAILDEYIKVTIDGFAAGFTGLQQTSCSELGYTRPGTPLQYPVQWGPDYWMAPLCRSKCDCTYTNRANSAPDACQDVPDKPSIGQYCSLCGPKYNKPMPVEMYLP